MFYFDFFRALPLGHRNVNVEWGVEIMYVLECNAPDYERLIPTRRFWKTDAVFVNKIMQRSVYAGRKHFSRVLRNRSPVCISRH